MATIHPFPPRRGHLYDPLVPYLDTAAIERELRDDRPDLAELLRNAGYEPTLRDDWDSFTAELRASPESHALCALVGFIAALALVALPFLAGWL